MDSRALQTICSRVYQRFPEMQGVRPNVQEYQGSQLLLIFKGSGKTADGRAIQRTVRVVANPDGKISKMTTSR